jgi:hypothetical protein
MPPTSLRFPCWLGSTFRKLQSLWSEISQKFLEIDVAAKVGANYMTSLDVLPSEAA